MISAVDELESVVKCIGIGGPGLPAQAFQPRAATCQAHCLPGEKVAARPGSRLFAAGGASYGSRRRPSRSNTFQPESLDEVARRPDELGQLALVFQEMARQVYAREQQLQRQVHQLRIEIDQARNASEVAEITESDFSAVAWQSGRTTQQDQGG